MDLAEGCVEVGEECKIVELKEASNFRCPLQGGWAVAIEGCWRGQPCVGLRQHVDVEDDVVYVVAVISCYR